MAQDLAGHVVDVTIRPADVNAYWLLGVSGTVTATGFFIDKHHNRIGDAFSTSIPQADGESDPVRIAASIPDNAVGACLRLSGDVYFDLNGSPSAADDFKSNYGLYPKLIADPEFNSFGRV